MSLVLFSSILLLIDGRIICVMYGEGRGYRLKSILTAAFDPEEDLPPWFRWTIKSRIYYFWLYLAMFFVEKSFN